MSIVKYLEQKEPNLFDLLSDLCVVGRLNGNTKYNGITFIIPSKETIDEIDRLSLTNLRDAIALSLYHIIDDYIPTINSWKLKKSDIPNGNKKHMEAKSFTNKKITLANGAVIEIDSKFRGTNSAIWRVTSGKIQFNNNDKPAKYTYAIKGTPNPKPTRNLNSRLRKESKRNLNRKNFVKNILIEYVDALTSNNDEYKFHNPFWVATINFLESSPERFQKYKGVISKSTYSTFLLLFGEISPISDEINEWLADPDKYQSGKTISEVLEGKSSLSSFPFPKLETKFRDAVDLECVVLHETESNFLSPRPPESQEVLKAIKLVSRTLYKGKMKNLSRSTLTTLENARLSDNCNNHILMYDNYQDFKQPEIQTQEEVKGGFPDLE